MYLLFVRNTHAHTYMINQKNNEIGYLQRISRNGVRNGEYQNRIEGIWGSDVALSITFYTVLTCRTMLIAYTPKVNNLSHVGQGEPKKEHKQ